VIAPAVVLVTDFGWRDPWVAETKAALLTAWAHEPPDVARPVIVDGGHDIPRGDVAGGAWFLGRLLPRFPAGTVFVAVVDPGVGTARPAVAVRAGAALAVGPGNGLLAELATGPPVVLAPDAAAGDPASGRVSATFHGRDVVAPAAARLAMGTDLQRLGAGGRAADLGPAPRRTPGPAVRWIDRFGNAVTDLEREGAAGRRLAAGGVLAVGGRTVAGPCATYGDAPADEPFWYWGSGDTVEIAVAGGDAARALGLEPGLVLAVGAV
jgi:S-adenosylmethionine hydrolase